MSEITNRDKADAAMSDKPILFSSAMVRALLAGTKTQTRRVPRWQPKLTVTEFVKVATDKATGRTVFNMRDGNGKAVYGMPVKDGYSGEYLPPYAIGDRVWVRESIDKMSDRGDDEIGYMADWPGDGRGLGWRPSIHMPRWASRLTLTVTDVKVERLQEISRDDARAEGLIKLPATGRYVVEKGDQYLGAADHDPRTVYRWLWDGLNESRGVGWETNPWVVAYTFTVRKGNIDG